MRALKKQLAEQKEKSQALKEEVEKLREEYTKKAKSIRSDILETMDQLPAAFYKVSSNCCTYYNSL